MVSGAPDANSDAGAGYVFTTGSTWSSQTEAAATLTARFRPSDDDPATQLGWSSAISEDGSTIVVGASGNIVDGDEGGAGSALVYVKPMSGWTSATETAKLTASDGGDNDLLGTAVATSSDGSTVIAGTESTVNPGAVYVFVKPALGGWADAHENAKLTASDGVAGDYLGSSLAISSDGSKIVAGAPTAKVSGATNQGAVHIFDKPSTGWATGFETTKLIASDGAANNALGGSVSSSSDGTTVVAGAAAAAGDKGVTYAFGPSGSGASSYPLSVSVSPTGSGSVSSQPAGIARTPPASSSPLRHRLPTSRAIWRGRRNAGPANPPRASAAVRRRRS